MQYISAAIGLSASLILSIQATLVDVDSSVHLLLTSCVARNVALSVINLNLSEQCYCQSAPITSSC